MVTLEEALLQVEGVTDAIVTIGESGPVGIQLEVAPDSDHRQITATIGEILARRGLNAAFSDERPQAPPRVEVAITQSAKAIPAGKRKAIAAVAIAEHDRGVELAVRMSDGGRWVGHSPADEAAMWRALGELLYEAMGRHGARPLIESVEWTQIGEVSSVVVVVTAGEHRRLGASPATATRALAVARAIWSALD